VGAYEVTVTVSVTKDTCASPASCIWFALVRRSAADERVRGLG
jgi:hypothetical protein